MTKYTPIGEPPPWNPTPPTPTSGATTTVTTDLRDTTRQLPNMEQTVRARAIASAVVALDAGAPIEDVLLAADYIISGKVVRNEA